MKKNVLMIMFFCIPVLCCLAQEMINSDKNNHAFPLFSYSSLPMPFSGSDDDLVTQSSRFGFSKVNSILSTNTLEWEKANSAITKYSEEYKRNSKPVFQWGLVIGGGVLMAMAGILGATNPDGDYMVNILLFSFGLSATAGGLVWVIID